MSMLEMMRFWLARVLVDVGIAVVLIAAIVVGVLINIYWEDWRLARSRKRAQ